MKKQRKRKLVLEREVVKALVEERLHNVQGGLLAGGATLHCGCTEEDSGCGIVTR